MRPTVLVMVKEARAGRVKTRLGREIGMTRAAWWYRHQTARLLRRLSDPRWRVVLAVSPDTSRNWPPLPRVPQGRGDLGDRMDRLLRSAPPAPVVLIGSDIPGVDRTAIAGALTALRGHDAVIGPALDGGYWLIGVRAPHHLPKRAFDGVRWSGPHAHADTLAGLKGLKLAYAATHADVDAAADLQSA
ncbi:MAG: TIGR04282 family arsenosugar biosynthesis glycosyltransferase [Pseudomonadota bacterium]